MQIEKKVFSKLFKETAKNKFNKHSTKLGVTQDLDNAVRNFNNTLNTADKVFEIAQRVNSLLENVTEDVRFYNDYKESTIDTIDRNIDYVNDLLEKADNLANELGVSTDFDGNYQEAKVYIEDAANLKNLINDNPLIFDI